MLVINPHLITDTLNVAYLTQSNPVISVSNEVFHGFSKANISMASVVSLKGHLKDVSLIDFKY